MSDPFASLLTSFKEGNSKPSNINSSSKEAKGTIATKFTPTTSANTKPIIPHVSNSTLNVSSTPLVASSSSTANMTVHSSIHDDLEDLFGMPTNHKTNTNIPPAGIEVSKTIVNDDLDSAFDVFSNKSVSQPVLEIDSKEDVVDEVKDMEVAKLMSLGLTITKANEYYDKDIMYEDILKRQKQKSDSKRKYHNHQHSRNKETSNEPLSGNYSDLFDNTYNNNRIARPTNNIFSMATDFLNKGKELVDQLTAYPEEEANRLFKYRDVKEDTIDKPSFGSTREPNLHEKNNESYIDITESEVTKPLPVAKEHDVTTPVFKEGNLLEDFDDSVMASNKQQPILQQSNPQGNDTLIEFDSNPIEVDIQTSTAVKSYKPLENIPISSIELSGYSEFKERGSEYFKVGDYILALQEYEKSLNTLPHRHPLRIIACSNMIAAQIKVGEYTKSIETSKQSLSLFPEDSNSWIAVIQNSEPKRTYRDIWPKIVMRQGEAYEHLENYKEAFAVYQLLMENGIFNEKVLEGKRRCQKVLNPIQKTPISLSGPKKLITKSKDQLAPVISEKKYENVERVKNANRQEEEEEAQRTILYDKVETKIETWKANKGEDIRHLLANLPEVLTWSDWKPVSTADLVMPKKVKVTYMKAIAKTHPDKIPQSLELENKMIAENVFSILSTAWEKFKVDNNMN